MPVIKVYSLPIHKSPEFFDNLRADIITAVISILELGLNKNSVTCIFIPDGLVLNYNREIIVEVTGLFEKPERTREVRNRLAQIISEVVEGYIPKAMIEVFVFLFDQETQGFYCK